MLDPKQFLTLPRITSAPAGTHCPIVTLPALFHDGNHLERSFAGAQLSSGSLHIPDLLTKQHPLPRTLQQEANPLSSRKGSDSQCSPRKSIPGRISHSPRILQEAFLLNLKLLCHLHFELSGSSLCLYCAETRQGFACSFKSRDFPRDFFFSLTSPDLLSKHAVSYSGKCKPPPVRRWIFSTCDQKTATFPCAQHRESRQPPLLS